MTRTKVKQLNFAATIQLSKNGLELVQLGFYLVFHGYSLVKAKFLSWFANSALLASGDRWLDSCRPSLRSELRISRISAVEPFPFLYLIDSSRSGPAGSTHQPSPPPLLVVPNSNELKSGHFSVISRGINLPWNKGNLNRSRKWTKMESVSLAKRKRKSCENGAVDGGTRLLCVLDIFMQQSLIGGMRVLQHRSNLKDIGKIWSLNMK